MPRGAATTMTGSATLSAPSRVVTFPKEPGPGARVPRAARPSIGKSPPWEELDDIFQGHRHVAAKASLYRAGEPFIALYLVRAGAFKTLIRAEDGREQVSGFYMGGDLLGADGIGADRYACEAIALEDSEVSSLPFAEIDQYVQDVPDMRRSLYRYLGALARRQQGMMLLLGSMCAEERLARFLLDLARRYHARGYSVTEFVLRMSRHEIASYLGLKLETISRLFSRFQGAGLLQVQGRAVKLLDLTALARLSGELA